MNLATAIAKMQKDPKLSALGYLDHGRPYYVALQREGSGIVLEAPPPVLTGRKLRVPFDIRGVDDSTRELIALVAKHVDWTLFRGGLPVEGR